MQSMAKLHSYYVTNASTEMSYAHSNITDTEFYNAINESFNDITEFSDDEINEQEVELNIAEYDDNDNLAENNKESPEFGNEITIENYFNFDDKDLQEALKMEVRVVIEQDINNYDHGEKNYDIDQLLEANFTKNS